MVTLAVGQPQKKHFTITMEGFEERPRKRQCHRRVRFTQDKPSTRTFNNYSGATTEEQRKEICRHIWYTREEFDAFLSDRLHTIRMWRAVGGNTRLIEPFYCIRGLEMYESAKLNGAVLTARSEHIRSVLMEQMSQRDLVGNRELDWEKLAQAVAPHSAWAMRQASRLALNDAMEAQQDTATEDPFAAGLYSMGSDDVSTSMRRLSMPTVTTATSFSSFSPSSSLSHLSIPTTISSLYMAGASRPRLPVDVHKLKEMNRQLLNSMTQQTCQPPQHEQQQLLPKLDKNSNMGHSNSLAVLLVRGRRHEMEHQTATSCQERPPLQLGHAIRRDSLHGVIREAARYSESNE